MIFAIIWAWILGHESGRNRCRQVVRQPQAPGRPQGAPDFYWGAPRR